MQPPNTAVEEDGNVRDGRPDFEFLQLFLDNQLLDVVQHEHLDCSRVESRRYLWSGRRLVLSALLTFPIFLSDYMMTFAIGISS